MKYRKIPKNIAQKIEVLRVGYGCSWWRIAEIVCDENPDLIKKYFKANPQEVWGHQWLGIDLCIMAAKTLKIPKKKYKDYW